MSTTVTETSSVLLTLRAKKSIIMNTKKGILKGKKLKNEKIKIKAKYKILGQKIEQCINIPNNIYGFVTDVIASL